MADKPAAPTKKQTRPPGTHALRVTINESLRTSLEATADGRPLNVWLSKLVERHISKCPEVFITFQIPEA
jgi:predicted HicB family RNase H-like nuclease